MSDSAPAVGKWERRIVAVLDALNVAQIKNRLAPRDLILTYHAVESRPSGYRYSVDHRLFAQQIDYLQTHFDIVDLDTMFRPKTGKRPRAAITFDDAYADFYEHVYPILRAKNVPATVFVPTAFIESATGLLERDDSIEKPHLTWGQMREIVAHAPVHFGSHTHSHRSAVNEIGSLAADLRQSIDLIEANIGERPCYFAYPYGLCNEQTHPIALECGFDKLLTMEDVALNAGPVQGRLDIYRRNESLPYFKLTTAGLLGPGARQRIREMIYRR